MAELASVDTQVARPIWLCMQAKVHTVSRVAGSVRVRPSEEQPLRWMGDVSDIQPSSARIFLAPVSAFQRPATEEMNRPSAVVDGGANARNSLAPPKLFW